MKGIIYGGPKSEMRSLPVNTTQIKHILCLRKIYHRTQYFGVKQKISKHPASGGGVQKKAALLMKCGILSMVFQGDLELS